MQVGILIHWRLYCIQFLWLTVNASLNTEDQAQIPYIYRLVIRLCIYTACLNYVCIYTHVCGLKYQISLDIS